MRSVHFFAQRPGPSLSSSLNDGPVLVMRSLSRSAANDPSQPAASRVYSRTSALELKPFKPLC